jgi:hypothetical protein
MSLAAIADHMASKGRGPDSMLIHMSPREVQGLQALAMKNGGSLTINPDTGLPEAGFLDKLLPTIIGAGLSFIPGVGPLLAAGIVGGIQTVRTGDLGKGLAAGLGAYGGAGLAQGLATAGGNILSGEATSLAAQQAGNLAGEQATQMGLSDLAKQQMIDEAGSATARVATDASPFAKLSAGVDAAKANPMQFANKDNFKYLAAAAGPILADQAIKSNMPTTVTKPGMIRPYSFDPYGGTYTAGTPYETVPTKAAGGGLMGMANERFNFARSGGPVVGMADGGPTYKQYSNEEIGKYLTDNPNVDIAAATKQFNADPAAVNQYISGLASGYTDPTATKGGSGTAGIYNQMKAQGVDPNELYAATTANNPNYATQGWSQADIAEQYNLHKGAYDLSNQLKGNVADKDWAKFMDANNYSVLDAARAFGLSTDEVQRRYDAARQPVSIADARDVPGGVGGVNAVVNYNDTITQGSAIPGATSIDPTTGAVVNNLATVKGLKDLYTAGGGSLGYTPTAPKTIDEFNASFNKLTGGSKQAYDYLMGKTPYSPTPYTPTGEIQKPYWESVGLAPVNLATKKYIFKDGKYEVNPAYVIPTYDKEGKKSLNLTNADVKTFMDKKPSTSDFYTWATTNNLTPEQIAAASKIPINEISKLFTGAKDLVDDDGKIDQTKVDEKATKDIETNWDEAAYLAANPSVAEELRTGKSASGQPVQYTSGYGHWLRYGKDQGWKPTVKKAAGGGLMAMARGGMAQQFDLGGYSDGGRLLRGPGDGVSDSIPATIGNKRPARLADGEFVVPARIVSELGNGSTEAGARKLYAMMDRVQAARRGSIGKGKVAKNTRAAKYLPA